MRVTARGLAFASGIVLSARPRNFKPKARQTFAQRFEVRCVEVLIHAASHFREPDNAFDKSRMAHLSQTSRNRLVIAGSISALIRDFGDTLYREADASICGLSKQIRAKLRTGNAGDALNIDAPFGGNTLPLVYRLPGNSEFGRQLCQPAHLFGGIQQDGRSGEFLSHVQSDSKTIITWQVILSQQRKGNPP